MDRILVQNLRFSFARTMSIEATVNIGGVRIRTAGVGSHNQGVAYRTVVSQMSRNFRGSAYKKTLSNPKWLDSVSSLIRGLPVSLNGQLLSMT